jgi:hypothetical protein
MLKIGNLKPLLSPIKGTIREFLGGIITPASYLVFQSLGYKAILPLKIFVTGTVNFTRALKAMLASLLMVL